MIDQANTLRKLMESRSESATPWLRFVPSTSASGALELSVALAAMLARRRYRVAWIGSGAEFPKAVEWFGISVEDTHPSARLAVEPGLWLLDASRTELDLAACDYDYVIESGELIDTLEQRTTWLILDADPLALTGAYGILKRLTNEGARSFGILVNGVTYSAQGAELFGKINEVVERHLDVALAELPHLPEDEKFWEGSRREGILIDWLKGDSSGHPVSRGLRSLVDRAIEGFSAESRFQEETVQSAPRKIAGILRSLLGEVKQ